MTDTEIAFLRDICMRADLVDSRQVLKVLDHNPTINELVKNAHRTAVSKGWWDKPRPVLELICLMHCELSEAAEAWRDPNDKEEHIVEELADVLIRIFDLCGASDWDLEKAVLDKMAFNKTRPYRHGGKLA